MARYPLPPPPRSAPRDGEPADDTASPRTTIVGGRPPETRASQVPVPTGIQQVLRLAAQDGVFLERVLQDRAAAARDAGILLSASERAVLGAIPGEALKGMVLAMEPPAAPRSVARQAATAAAVVLLGGAGLAASPGCSTPEPEPTPQVVPEVPQGEVIPEATQPSDSILPNLSRGIRPDVPPRPDYPPPPTGIAPDIPPERPLYPEMPTTGGAAPDEPPARPTTRDMDVEGGAAPSLPPQRPTSPPSLDKGGAAPDVPEETTP